MSDNLHKLLDSREKLAKLDQHSMLSSIEALPDQFRDAWEKTEDITFPADYPSVNNIVVTGMGGSALAGHIIKHLYKDELTISLEISSHYKLPAYVDSNSLVLLSSYSGNTEEIISAANDAQNRKAKLAVISSGGKLIELAKENNWPNYQIDPIYNPSNEPRMAVGYMVFGTLSLFSKTGLVNLSTDQILDLIDNLKELEKNLGPDSPHESPAKLLAYHAYDKMIVLSAAEHLIGAAHVTNNQLNENSKLLTAEWHLPEFNHHYMEALKNPKKLHEDLLFLLFNSHLYSKKLQTRTRLTADVIKKSGFEAEIIELTAPTPLEQVFELIMLGAYFNFYLAMLYGLDPAPIPNVDWFKQQLK